MITIEKLARVHRRDEHRIFGVSIENVTLGVGRCYGVLGVNGSGKTTLLRCLAGLYEFSGRIRKVNDRAAVIARHDLSKLSVYLDQFPERNVFPSLTIRENVALAASGANVIGISTPPDHVTALSEVGIHLSEGHFLMDGQKVVETLSGGQIQALSIYMAIVARKRLILLDEFLANLDPPRRIKMIATLRDTVEATESTIIYVSHNVLEAAKWCDEAIVLQDGLIRTHLDRSALMALNEASIFALYSKEM